MSNNRTNSDTQKAIKEYPKAWHEKMCEIWRDKIDLLGVFDTGALRNSVLPAQLKQDGMTLDLSFHFLEYGIYVDRGVGNGYKHDNGGDLGFLGAAYRHEHHYHNKIRKKRPWFSTSWRISTEVIKDKMADLMGESFANAFDNL